MKGRIILGIVIVLAVIGALAGIKVMQIKKLIAAAATFAPPPETISAAVARQDKWPSTLTAIGSITAAQGVNVTVDIPGTVKEIAFESGATVAKGDLLVRLDVSNEEAQLRAVESQVQLAQLNLDRLAALLKEKTVSQADFDAGQATLKQNQANADAIRATIEKKTVRAPFAGNLGIRQVNLGQYLDTGKPIVSLQALSPVFADFTLPQQDLARLQTGMRVRLTSDTYPGQQFEGALTAINPDLNAATRSVPLRATFDNPGQLLRPGMFAKVEVLLPGEQDVLVVPATSILSAPFGDSVYVIESQTATNGQSHLVVRQQFVRTGRARGDFVSVESGLKAGERIASAGLFKLRNGMTVVENNELVPKAAEKPRPADS